MLLSQYKHSGFFVCLFLTSVGCGMILLSAYRLHREGLGEMRVECRGCNVFVALECSKVYCMQCITSIRTFQMMHCPDPQTEGQKM